VITLSNGHSFTFIAASGALAYDGRGWPWEWPLRWAGLIDPGLFTVVTKTLTRHPRRGNLRWYNPLRCIRPLPAGAVNAVGLTNPGIEWWCREVAPTIAKKRYRLIVSLEAEEEKGLSEMIGMVEKVRSDNLVAIELNASCPNTFKEGERSTSRTIALCHAAKKMTALPLLLKIGVTHDPLTLARELPQIIEAFQINSVPWSIAFPQKVSPLSRFGGGGVSGRIAQKWTWKVAGELAAAGPIPVVGPSPWDYEDIGELFRLGAKAISFGSVFLWHPWRPTLFVRRWMRDGGA